MKKVYNYKKINNRLEELNNKRDEHEFFIGTHEELDELMELGSYKRQDIAHALCLDLQVNVTVNETWYRVNKDDKVKIDTIFLVLGGIPYTFELKEIEGENYSCYNNFYSIGVLNPVYHWDKVRKFKVYCRDISCCGCYFIQEEVQD